MNTPVEPESGQFYTTGQILYLVATGHTRAIIQELHLSPRGHRISGGTRWRIPLTELSNFQLLLDAPQNSSANPDLEELRRRVADDENAVLWGISCLECADLLDRCVEADEKRERAAAAIERVDALHQPTTVRQWIPCEKHATSRVMERDCPMCVDRPTLICAAEGCGTWPCATHLALHDETEPTCNHPIGDTGE
ncbi:hypothetical protein ABZ470_39905 [Streptosporangium sp. NPDC020072]|uniref:hypothetical protein n=1 Tax=Streptosporangium sp. NPDC020072 TaxID=3154788 RepID=UPI0034284D42